MTAFLADDCVVYFGGMGAPASVGVDAVVTDLERVLAYWRMVERRVLARGVDAEGSTIFASMNNRLEILGHALDYPETEVVTFDAEQKITRYELYCDPSPIKAVFAERSPTSSQHPSNRTQQRTMTTKHAGDQIEDPSSPSQHGLRRAP